MLDIKRLCVHQTAYNREGDIVPLVLDCPTSVAQNRKSIKMSSLTLYLLACLMSVTIVSSLEMEIPSVVEHPDLQCQKQNYPFTCTYLTESYSPNCRQLECAWGPHGEAKLYRTVRIGYAAQGTICGMHKVCYDGECIDLPKGFQMPQEIGEAAVHKYCSRPKTAPTTSPGPNKATTQRPYMATLLPYYIRWRRH